MAKNNPPAFPADQSGDGYHSGMTLRDYFAAAAMQACLSIPCDPDEPEVFEEAIKRIPTVAYEYADAMLAARKEQS